MAVKAGLGRSVAASAAAAVDEAVAAARQQLGGEPALALVGFTVDYEASEVHEALRRRLPGVPVQGVSSSLGVLSLEGVLSGPHGALAVLLLEGGRFATGQAAGGGEQAGAEAARRLLEGLGGQRPDVVLLEATPGDEEAVLAGIAQVLPGVPAFGGSAADHLIAGDWRVLTEAGVLGQGVSLAGLAGVAWGGALVVPYAATDQQVKVDRSEGRTLTSLGGRAPGQVLDEWLGGALAFQLASGGNVLAQTALRPLGVRHELAGGQAHYLTVHPAHLHEDGRLDVFARLAPGTVVCSMQGTEAGLLGALDELLDRALAAGGMETGQVRAGVLIYCAGCSAAVGDALSQGIRDHLGARLAGVPVLGLCTFGEQGHVASLGNVHQNLALGLVLLA